MSVPRLGFVGVGWIGAMRLEAVAESGRAAVAALCDADPDRLAAAAAKHEGAATFPVYEELLERAASLALDGIVIATPNALHAPQALAALGRGLAVFCQKPLALSAADAREMVDAARRADRLLGVDYSYRYTDGAQALRRMVRAGELGRIVHVESIFHNAYGPDKAWCHEPSLAGGGALMDLGVHQIDLPLWILGASGVRSAHGRTFRAGQPLDRVAIDDFAVAELELEGGTRVHLAVSWHAHAGRDCVIRTSFFGTAGGAEFHNIDGSFYDFELERWEGRQRRVVGRESRAWLGRAILDWVDRLAESPAYDADIEGSVHVAEVVDAIYAQGAATTRIEPAPVRSATGGVA